MALASSAWLRAHADSGWSVDAVMGVPMQRILEEQLSEDDIIRIANDKQGANVMDNQSLYLPIMDKNIRFVEVQFYLKADNEKGKPYTYKTDLVLEVGDTVVVETYGWYSVATVTKLVPMPLDELIYRWVVDVVGTEGHARRLKYERDVVEQVNSKRIEGMRAQLLSALGLDVDSATLILDHVLADDKDV